MGLKPRFTRESLHQYTQKRADLVEQLLIRSLKILGEQAVNICRQKHTYMDQTGNLTSSIGYELFVNGKSIATNFQARAGSESGDYGVSRGQALATQIGPSGNYTLVIVAGMPYAEEVEARNKEVLTPGYLFLEKELPKVKANILKLLKTA